MTSLTSTTVDGGSVVLGNVLLPQTDITSSGLVEYFLPCDISVTLMHTLVSGLLGFGFSTRISTLQKVDGSSMAQTSQLTISIIFSTLPLLLRVLSTNDELYLL